LRLKFIDGLFLHAVYAENIHRYIKKIEDVLLSHGFLSGAMAFFGAVREFGMEG